MSKQRTKELSRDVRAINETLWKYYYKIYSDESNDTFDAEHDSLLMHIEGFAEVIDEIEEDIYCAHDNILTTEEIDSWYKSLEDDYKFVNELVNYYNAVVKTKATPPNYLYA